MGSFMVPYLQFLTGSWVGQQLEVTADLVLGRAPVHGVTVPDPSMSGEHCQILLREGQVWIEDLDSTNGTQVNGQTVHAVRLNPGDVIEIGETRIVLEFKAEDPHVPRPANVLADADTTQLDDQNSIAQQVQSKSTTGMLRKRRVMAAFVSAGASLRRFRDGLTAPGNRLRTVGWICGAVGVIALVILSIVLLARLGHNQSETADGQSELGAVKPHVSTFPDDRPAISAANAENALALMATTEAAAAKHQLKEKGIPLTLRECIGVDRTKDPVTSGVPLPEGSVTNAATLQLLGPDNKSVPCQFSVLSHWPSALTVSADKPEGSIKWVLLDFQADVAASNSVGYVLNVGGTSSGPAQPVKVNEDGLNLQTGNLKLGIDTNLPGLIHFMAWEGRVVVSPTNPVQAVLVNEEGVAFRGTKPGRVVVEHAGDMRTTVLIQGQFESKDGKRLHAGRVGYDLRITAYAGRPFVKLAFTIRNDGSHEKKDQWLFARSLSLEVPIEGSQLPGGHWQMNSPGGPVDLSEDKPAVLTQWYKYPRENRMNWPYYENNRRIASPAEVERETTAGITETNCGFYVVLEQGQDTRRIGDRVPGWICSPRV